MYKVDEAVWDELVIIAENLLNENLNEIFTTYTKIDCYREDISRPFDVMCCVRLIFPMPIRISRETLEYYRNSKDNEKYEIIKRFKNKVKDEYDQFTSHGSDTKKYQPCIQVSDLKSN